VHLRQLGLVAVPDLLGLLQVLGGLRARACARACGWLGDGAVGGGDCGDLVAKKTTCVGGRVDLDGCKELGHLHGCS